MDILFGMIVVLILYACGQFCCVVDVNTHLLALVPHAGDSWLLFSLQIK
jgi:hypothetical protein